MSAFRRLLALLPLFAAALSAAPALPAKKDLPLFLLAGQSNMAGRGSLKELSAAEAAAHQRIHVLNTGLARRPAVDPSHRIATRDTVHVSTPALRGYGCSYADAYLAVAAGNQHSFSST